MCAQIRGEVPLHLHHPVRAPCSRGDQDHDDDDDDGDDDHGDADHDDGDDDGDGDDDHGATTRTPPSSSPMFKR